MSEAEFSGGHLLPYKFNPSFLTDAEVIESFVVRTAELEAVLGVITKNNASESNRNVLVTAPRGAGKTTLVRRVLAETRVNPSFSSMWFPLVLGEESYAITTPGEFFLECLFHLQDQAQTEDWVNAFKNAERQNNDSDLLDVAVSELRRFSQHIGKKILLIVENLHMILIEQIGHQANVLRETFARESCLMLLATSVKDPNAELDNNGSNIWLSQDFEPIPLRPLDLTESKQLWTSLTKQDVRAERIRPIQILTGGSPRLMRIMAEFTVTPSLQIIMENRNQIIDQNTEYFKSQLDNLPPTERKVFAALLDIWDPSTAKDVAQSARVNVNVASAMLGRLADRGSVVKLPGKGRAVTYHAAERLFNIYYLMRRRSHPSSRVRALVAFMTQYYRNEELVDTTAKLVAEACLLHPHRRQEYHSAYNAIIAQSSGEIRQKILSQTPEDFLSPLLASAEFRLAIAENEPVNAAHLGQRKRRQPRKRRDELLSLVRQAMERDEPAEAEQLLRDAIAKDGEDFQLWLELTLVLGKNAERFDDALVAARRAVQLNAESSVAHAMLGWLTYQYLDDETEAEQHLEAALRLDESNVIALSTLGDIKHVQEDIEQALTYYQRARKVAPDLEQTLLDLVYIKGPHMGDFEEAEKLLRAAIAEHPDWDDARRFLAQCLLRLDKRDEAERVLRAGVENNPGSPEAWFDLALLLHRPLRKYVESAVAFQKAIDLDASDGDIWGAYAQLLRDEGENLPEALAASSKAIELDPSSVRALITRAQINSKSQLWSDAENDLKAATAIPDSGYLPWFEYGMYLQDRPGRLDDAETALRAAVAASNGFPCAVPKELAALLIHRGKDDEAKRILDDAMEQNGGCYCSLTLNGGIATRKCDTDEAKQYFLRAHEQNPEGITAMTSLARVAIELEHDQATAEEWVEKAISTDPDDPRVFLARALVRRENGSVDECMADLQRCLSISPDFGEAKLLLALMLSEHSDPVAAEGLLMEVVSTLNARRELLSGVVDTAISLAQRGHGRTVLEGIEHSDARDLLEPLTVALHILNGVMPVKANEVMEVAHDIVSRIEKRDTLQHTQ